jgi:hypothetical protein
MNPTPRPSFTSLPALALAARIAVVGALLPAAAALAQAAPDDAAAVREAPATVVDRDASGSRRSSWEVRSELSNLLRQSPSELATILVLDPTLLSNQAFLGGYPELAAFVGEHPEVRRNPRFYLEEFSVSDGAFSNALEPMLIFGTFTVMAFAIAWLIRTLIEHRRWSRLARTQSEVHTKILERFGTSEALLEYMRTPAGSRFLESAPIPLHSEPAVSAPIGRALLSIQIGLVVAAGAAGMLAVSGRFDLETAKGFYALGMIGICVGAGFVLSALVSLFLSRRLGLWQGPLASGSETADEAGLGR